MSAEETKPVTKLITPISLPYEVTAGQDLSEFLTALMQKLDHRQAVSGDQ